MLIQDIVPVRQLRSPTQFPTRPIKRIVIIANEP